jgi:hypothetical protein
MGIGSIVIGPVIIGRGSVCTQYCFITGQTHLGTPPAYRLSSLG